VKHIFRSICCLLTVITNVPFCAYAAGVEAQRAWFYEAREALNAADMGHYREIKSHLKNYPLTPYLELWEATRELETGNDRIIGNALEKYANIPEAYDLKIRWIRNLASRGQWHQVAAALDRNPPVADRLPEIAMLTLWYTGKREQALELFNARWMKGNSTPELAFRLQRQWQLAGHPTRDEVWQRLGHFAHRGNWKEVHSLEKILPQQDRVWVSRWQSMHQEPLATLRQWKKNDNSHVAAAMIINDGLQKLSRSNAAEAWKELHRLEPLLDAYRFCLLERNIALQGAKQHLQASAGWLAALPTAMQTEKTRTWQVRVHLIHGEWLEAMKAIKTLPELEQQESRWSYWRARSLAALGLEEDAAKIYEKTAAGRGYYSFMSAERLNRPYSLSASSLTASSIEIMKLEKVPAMQRAREWWLLGEAGMAQREWSLALVGASKARWKAAAELASKWQWHDRVIQAAFMSGEIDALERRFPTAYRQVVADMSTESGLSSSLIWSIIRQESAFNVQAVSRTGAKGLMQLMPATAKEVADSNHVESPDLFNPDDNIRLGSLYLSALVERFNNHALAAAAYNAGPHRVSKWLEQQPFDQADIWIESIPFDETRRYVQQVLAFTVVYDWRQEKKPAGIVTQIDLQAVAQSDAEDIEG